MDTELVVWILFFVGGYSAVVGYLLWIAMRSNGGADPTSGGAGPSSH